MKFRLTLLSLCLFIGYSALGQNFNYEWMANNGKNQGNGVNFSLSMVADNNGSTINVGYFTYAVDFDPDPNLTQIISSNGVEDIFIQKLNPDGSLAWVKTIGGIGSDRANCIRLDNVGNIYIAGSFANVVDFDPNPNHTENRTSNGYIDIFVLKLDVNGNFMWVQTWGGAMFDEAISLALDANNNMYVTGRYEDTVDFNNDPLFTDIHTSNGGSDIFVLSLDQNGMHQWVNTAGLAGYDTGRDITVSPSGAVYATGYYDYMSSSGTKFYIQKFLGNGTSTLDWVKSFGGNGTYSVAGKSIATDSYGNVFVTGEFDSTIDFNPGSGVENRTSNGWQDGFVLSLKDNSDFRWVQTFGGSDRDAGLGIRVDNNNNIYVGGQASYFGAQQDFTLKGYNNAGSTLFDYTFSNSPGQYGYARLLNIAINPNGCQLYAIGGFIGSIDFDPDTNNVVAYQTTTLNLENFVLKLSVNEVFNPDFTYDVDCDGNLTVQGSAQSPGANPSSDWYLIEYFPNNPGQPEAVRETIFWWQQSNPYTYNTHPITFGFRLKPGRFYYVKHGMHTNCSPWQESREYNITYFYGGAPNPVFHLAKTSSSLNFGFNSFATCDSIYLVETYESAHGYNYNGYYIDLWERPCGSTTSFNWHSTLGYGYTQLPQKFDVKTAFNQNGVVFTDGTEYRIKLAMWNDCDGWEEYTVDFCVFECPLPRPQGGTTSTKTTNVIDKEIKLYPNPTQDILNLKAEELKIESYRILDILGRVYKSASYTQKSIEVSSLQQGTYVIEIKTSKGIIRKQFVKV